MCKMAANGSCMRGKGTQVSVPMRVRRSAGGHCVSWHQAGKTLRERQARRHDETAKQWHRRKGSRSVVCKPLPQSEAGPKSRLARDLWSKRWPRRGRLVTSDLEWHVEGQASPITTPKGLAASMAGAEGCARLHGSRKSHWCRHPINAACGTETAQRLWCSTGRHPTFRLLFWPSISKHVGPGRSTKACFHSLHILEAPRPLCGTYNRMHKLQAVPPRTMKSSEGPENRDSHPQIPDSLPAKKLLIARRCNNWGTNTVDARPTPWKIADSQSPSRSNCLVKGTLHILAPSLHHSHAPPCFLWRGEGTHWTLAVPSPGCAPRVTGCIWGSVCASLALFSGSDGLQQIPVTASLETLRDAVRARARASPQRGQRLRTLSPHLTSSLTAGKWRNTALPRIPTRSVKGSLCLTLLHSMWWQQLAVIWYSAPARTCYRSTILTCSHTTPHEVRQIGGKRRRSRDKLTCAAHRSTAITAAWEMQVLPADLNASLYLNYMLNLTATGQMHSSAAFACVGSSVGICHHRAWYLLPGLSSTIRNEGSIWLNLRRHGILSSGVHVRRTASSNMNCRCHMALWLELCVFTSCIPQHLLLAVRASSFSTGRAGRHSETLQGNTAVQRTVSDSLNMLGGLQARRIPALPHVVTVVMSGPVEHPPAEGCCSARPHNPKTRLKHMPLVGDHLANSAVHKFSPDAVFSEIWATLVA